MFLVKARVVWDDTRMVPDDRWARLNVPKGKRKRLNLADKEFKIPQSRSDLSGISGIELGN